MDVEIQAVSILYDGEQANYVKVIDITERKKVEASLQQTMLKLRQSLKGTISVISKIIDMRDPYTSSHQKNVAEFALMIGQGLGLSAEKIEDLQMAALIHDIGKIDVPTEILCKPTKLRKTEFELIKEHPQSGFDAIKNSELSETIKQVILQHHERLDGSGYPQGLKSEDILLEAKIIAVADVVDAMVSHRPYRASLGLHAALVEIMKNRGTLYDSEVVGVCFKILTEEIEKTPYKAS
jgi:HD-GYP domain-containing protein (c-di-GMP phosphodiesterase class II)